jgi:hypothetical protein
MSNRYELTYSNSKIPIIDNNIILDENLEEEEKNLRNPFQNENEVNFKAK